MSKKRKANHGRQRPAEKKRLGPGEARVTQVVARDGSYVRVMAEYRSLSANAEGVPEAITNGMMGGAKIADLRILAQQRADEVERGELLTPDGLTVIESWLPGEGEIIILKSRPSSIEDLAELPRYGESDAEPRKAEARRLLAERNGPAVLAGVGDAVD
jgi:hypothetical protein